ncbi:hypothetical protein J2X56_005276 [Herbaspirillum sp. 1173]|nr:hypothetical protein [Herbaspirillum sp. 1173]
MFEQAKSRACSHFHEWSECAGKRGEHKVSEAQRLKALEAENAKLKKLLAESLLDNAALKDVLGRKW